MAATAKMLSLDEFLTKTRIQPESPILSDNVLEEPALTVLSFGAGQDSTTLLYLYLHDAEFRAQYASNAFIVVMANTGDEHPQTLRHIEKVAALCEAHGIEFYFLTNDMGYHSDKWPDLRSFYHRTNTCGSKVFRKTCTSNLKLNPIFRFLEEYLGREYGVEVGRKKGFYEFTEQYGKVRMLVGIAKGEECRVAKKTSRAKWQANCIEVVYPLIDLGLDRAGCQATIRELGYAVPIPSSCLLCPFLSLPELLWLARNYRQDFEEWVQIEAAKLSHCEDRWNRGDANHGVWPSKSKVFGEKITLFDETEEVVILEKLSWFEPSVTLRDKLAEAEQKYRHWTDEALNEYKYSHGHCVASHY